MPCMVQIDSKYRVLDLDWVVTDAALSQGSRGATTEIFAPVQGFFQVATVSDLQIKVSPLAFTCPMPCFAYATHGRKLSVHRCIQL